MTMLSN